MQSTHLLSGDSASGILRTHLATPLHSQRVSSLLDFSTQGACSLLELLYKKLPITKQTKDDQEPTESYRGSRGLSPAGLWTIPSQACLQSREHYPTPPPTLPSQQIKSGAYTGATCVRARLIVRGLAIRGPAWPHQVQLRVQPLPGAQTQVCQPAPRGLLRPQAQPPARPPGKGLFPTKAPGRGQEDAVVRSWLPGLLSKQNQRESRAARAWPGRVPYARGPGVGRAEPGSPNPGSAARCAPGRAAPRHRGRKSAAAGPGRQGRGARRGVSLGTYARLGGCSRKVSGLCALGCSRLFSPRCPLARPPTRFPPARTALAPSARLRCGVNWNQSRRLRDSHNAQRAARHIPSRLCASGHPSCTAPALTLFLRPRARGTLTPCSLDVCRSVPQLHRRPGDRPCALKHPSLTTLDARRRIHPSPGCALNRGAGAEQLLQRTSQPVCLE